MLRLGPAVRTSVESLGPRLLGVETRLDHASVSLKKGRIQLKGLWVANPEGFEQDTFLKADVIRVETDIGALRRKEVHLREIFLANPEITFERTGGRSNIEELLDRLRMDNGEGEDREPPEGQESGEPPRLKVDLFHVKDAKVRLILDGQEVTATLSSIELRNLQDADGNGLPAREVVRRFITSIAESVQGFADLSEDMQSLADDLKADWHSGPSEQEIEETPLQ